MRQRTRWAAVAVAVMLAAACDEPDLTVFDGVYSGDGVDSQDSGNRKEFTLTLTGTDTAVAGTYRIKAPILDVSGTVSGTRNGSGLELVLTPASTECPYRISGTWADGRIRGSYAAFSCFVRSDGTLDLKKK